MKYVNAESTDSFNRNENKFTVMKNDGAEGKDQLFKMYSDGNCLKIVEVSTKDLSCFPTSSRGSTRNLLSGNMNGTYHCNVRFGNRAIKRKETQNQI
jgi:hypothetical protein